MEVRWVTSRTEIVQNTSTLRENTTKKVIPTPRSDLKIQKAFQKSQNLEKFNIQHSTFPTFPSGVLGSWSVWDTWNTFLETREVWKTKICNVGIFDILNSKRCVYLFYSSFLGLGITFFVVFSRSVEVFWTISVREVTQRTSTRAQRAGLS